MTTDGASAAAAGEDVLRPLIRDIPGFPEAGVLFHDVTPLLRDAQGLGVVVRRLGDLVARHRVDVVAGVESRGFIFGAPLAVALGVGFVPIRKLGKLPAATIRRDYALEYGTNSLEIHRDAVGAGESVLIVDDVLATGGTARASVELVEALGARVAATAFVLELEFLQGRKALAGYPVHALLQY